MGISCHLSKYRISVALVQQSIACYQLRTHHREQEDDNVSALPAIKISFL